MSKIVVKPGQDIEDALKMFNNKVKKSGTLKDVRKRDYFEKPGVQKRNKRKENARIKKNNF
jgi:small subunit ribosomal protein S21